MTMNVLETFYYCVKESIEKSREIFPENAVGNQTLFTLKIAAPKAAVEVLEAR